MLKIIAGVVEVLMVVVLGWAMTKPDSFRVQRSVTIQAAPEKVFLVMAVKLDVRRLRSFCPNVPRPYLAPDQIESARNAASSLQ